MADNELLIKISADAKNAQKAFDDVRDQTEDLEKSLGKVALISAAGFAALTAEVGFSLKAFEEAEAASRQLNQALQAQGIYTKELTEDYKSYADAVEASTGIDGDAITSAQAVAQSILGQTKITKDLTFAIADLATAKGIDLNSAANLVAKTIATETNALAREGLQLSATATETERYARTLEFLQGRYSGQAEAAAKGLGGLKALETQFGNLQEAIGARFAPAAESAIRSLTSFFSAVAKNDELVNLIVSLTTAGLAVSAIGIAIPTVVAGLGAMRAALAAAGVAATGTQIAVRALIGSTGIGLLVIALTEVALHWDTVWPRIKAVALGALKAMYNAFVSFNDILYGVFTFDVAKVQEGVKSFKEAFVNGFKEATKEIPAETKKAVEEQSQTLKVAADKRAAIDASEQAKKRELAKANQELLNLQLQNASQASIDIKKAEIETLKQLITAQNATERGLLQDKYDKLRESEENQRILDEQRRAEFNDIVRASREETNTQELEDQTIFQEQKRLTLEAGLLTEQEIRQKALNEEIKQRADAQNKRLIDTQKYGAAFAAINQVINSDEVQGTKKATSELVALTQSKNASLKAIGKAATIANITIKTAESAMNIFTGFSSIPFIGYGLGVAGAAAAVAFGAEQVGNVVAAADGGLITGGMAGRDSVPAMLMPGELVTPRKNFEEVIQGVQMVRGMSEGGGESSAVARVELAFTDDVMDFIEAKLVERQNLNVSIIGA